MKKTVTLAIICTLFLASSASAVITVRDAAGAAVGSTYANIQAAIVDAYLAYADGGWIYVDTAGTPYGGAGNTDILMIAPMTVMAVDDATADRPRAVTPGAVEIDCEGAARAFLFLANQNLTDINTPADANEGFIISGFKITNGYAPPADLDYSDIAASNRGCGGGIIIDAGNPVIENCIFTQCESDSFMGGALLISGGGGGGGGGSGNAMIRSSIFYDNYAPYGGGGIAIRSDATPDIINCLVVQNRGDMGAGMLIENSAPNVELCTVADNVGYLGVYCDGSTPEFLNSILWGNWYGDSPDIDATYCIVDSIDITGTNVTNINPLLVQGMYAALWDAAGFYYLDPLSTAVDAGNGTMGNPYSSDYFVTMPRFTNPGHTERDSRDVDLGFHYPAYNGEDIDAVLTITIDPVPVHGSVAIPIVLDRHGAFTYNVQPDVPGGNVYTLHVGDTVYMTAVPDPNYRVRRWTGTADEGDSIFDLDNLDRHIHLFDDATVQCSFEQDLPSTLNYPGQYGDLQYAVNIARSGDTIIIHPGTYRLPGYGSIYGNGGYSGSPCVTVTNKAITIRSVAPDDPATVANTVIEPDWGFITAFAVNGCGRDTVISGLTILNANLQGGNGLNGTNAAPRGGNGTPEYGAGMTIDGSATVLNCRFENCTVTGGNGGNGAVVNNLGYDGGHGGWAGGGAIYVGSDLRGTWTPPFGWDGPWDPIFKNVQFVDCFAQGGSGGNGGQGRDWWGRGGSYKMWTHYDQPWLYFGEETDGTRIERQGDGGAVYIHDGIAEFEDCTFSNAYAQSGVSGMGSHPYMVTDIASAGGAVYVGGDQWTGVSVNPSAKFTRCTFTNSRTDLTITNLYDSPYIGYGGAVAADETASLTLIDCTLSDNKSHIGGAVYWTGRAGAIYNDNAFVMENSTFLRNEGLQGGAIYGIGGTLSLLNCRLELNTAKVANTGGGVDPNLTGGGTVFTQGGAVYIGSVDALIGDSVFTTNETTHSGGALCISGHNKNGGQVPRIYNNLFLSNKADRDGGAVVSTDGAEPNLANCTMVANTATGSGFATGSGGALSVTAGSRAEVENCLLWDNTAFVGPQISLVDPNGGGSYQYSSAHLAYCKVQSGQTGIKTDAGSYLTYDASNVEGSTLPRFVSFESSVPYAYTDERFITNYSLSVIGAAFAGGTLQDVNSPCIDAGNADLDNPALGKQPLLPLGRYAYTLRTDGEHDMGNIDIGYHRRKAGVYPTGDINYSGVVNILDYAAMSDFWLRNDCAYPDWCEGSDLDNDANVNSVDYALLAQLYGADDVTAPIPNPSQWSMAPAANSGSTVTMVATTAVDNSGNTVEYYFECVSAGGNNRAWATSPSYTDVGLTTGNEYGYRVKARDVIPVDPDRHNETGWSPTLYAFVGEDGRPPSPNPSQWETVPYAVSATSVAMTARSAVDASGVEYYFRCESGTNGYDSGWQASSSFINIGLLPSTTYTYSVKTRDLSAALNTGALSTQASATTLPSPDILPPIPNDAQWFLRPIGTSTTTIAMSATPAFDLSGVEYFFECTFGGHDHDSGWQQVATYTATGLLESTRYDFRLLVRDRSVARNACVPTEAVSAWTLASGGGGGPGNILTPPTPNPMIFSNTNAITDLTAPNGLPFQIVAYQVNPPLAGPVGYYHIMTAAVATDYTGSFATIEYYFECITDNRRSSGWIAPQDPTTGTCYYWIRAGDIGWPQVYVWRVKARDIWGTETGWSPAAVAGGIPF